MSDPGRIVTRDSHFPVTTHKGRFSDQSIKGLDGAKPFGKRAETANFRMTMPVKPFVYQGLEGASYNIEKAKFRKRDT